MIQPRQVLLSIGSNIEPIHQRVNQALDFLATNVLTDAIVSPWYSTPPLGYTQQNTFVNVAMVGYSTSTPHELHLAVKGLEVSLGRVHRELWREREIDIDIILIGQEIVSNLMLSIPHPRFRTRRFVLQPAADIAPDLIDPVSGFSISQLLALCPDSSVLTPL